MAVSFYLRDKYTANSLRKKAMIELILTSRADRGSLAFYDRYFR